jgi:acyl-ACP thioesterase
MDPTTPATPPPPLPMRSEPDRGRVYGGRRIVRSTDVTPDGRLRLDALARYLQTVAEDDVADAGLLGHALWLVRRCVLTVRAFPVMGDRITLRTFCSGTGPRWAERTTTVAGPAGVALQATAVWAAVDPQDGRPIPPGEQFLQVYGEAAQGRTVSARLSHPRPSGTQPDRPWPLRTADFDTAGHVNNAITWAAVEDVLAGQSWLPSAAEVEYHRAIRPGAAPRLAVADGDGGGPMMWLLADGQVLASARLAGPTDPAAAG